MVFIDLHSKILVGGVKEKTCHCFDAILVTHYCFSLNCLEIVMKYISYLSTHWWFSVKSVTQQEMVNVLKDLVSTQVIISITK